MPQHTAEERRKNKGTQDTGNMVVDFLAGKPVPGGPSSTAFQRVINALREVITGQDKSRKRKKSQADTLFGE